MIRIIPDNNSIPDHKMRRLSPNQISRLINLPWDNTNFPLKFNKKLKYSELKNSVFFINTITFLKSLIKLKNENTATATGNLNRKFVKYVFDKLILEKDFKDFTLKYNKVLNEIDVFPLHIIRVVCESAGLIHKRKDKFLVYKKYQHLLANERAGELYYLLFNSYFRKFNIAYKDRFAELHCIQHTIAYSIYRLGKVAEDYRNIEELPAEILLPQVLQEIREGVSEYIKSELVVSLRIIRPLEGFGLLECSYRKGKGDSKIDKVRKSQLYDRFVGEEW